MAFSLSANNISSILLDIEGTTTPIAFVYEVLFPFARAHVGEFLQRYIGSADVQGDLARLREEHTVDVAGNLNPPALLEAEGDPAIESTEAYFRWLMEQDRKSPGLKALQGKIWREGYAAGQLQALVFPDVLAALQRWSAAGLNLNIFSSGSILAQKLLFAHTDDGDLTGFLGSYFDTTTGAKSAATSYLAIAAELGQPTEQVLFISDVVLELDAARAAGMRTVLCVRPENHPQPSTQKHPSISSFAEIVQ